MAYTLDRFSVPLKAASHLPPKAVVRLDTVANQVLHTSANSQRPFGAVQATILQGYAGAIYEDPSYQKLVACASIGFGAEVWVASFGVASGYQGTGLATIAQMGVATGASGVVAWSVGLAMEPASAGDVFTVKLAPRQLGGAA